MKKFCAITKKYSEAISQVIMQNRVFYQIDCTICWQFKFDERMEITISYGKKEK